MHCFYQRVLNGFAKFLFSLPLHVQSDLSALFTMGKSIQNFSSLFPLGSFTGTNGQGEVLGFSDPVFGVTADFNTHNKWEGILKDQQLGQPGPLSEVTMEAGGGGDMAGMLHRQTSNWLCSFYTK